MRSRKEETAGMYVSILYIIEGERSQQSLLPSAHRHRHRFLIFDYSRCLGCSISGKRKETEYDKGVRVGFENGYTDITNQTGQDKTEHELNSCHFGAFLDVSLLWMRK